MKRIIFAFVLGLLAFPSCETDVDLTGEPKEIMVVYGLLDKNDSRHFLKVTKGFSTEGSAYEGAQDPSLMQYAADELDIFLHEYSNGSLINTFKFDTITIFNKDSGTFFYPKQLVYKFDGTINPSNSYHLKIKNKDSGLEVSSQTNLVTDVSVVKPRYKEGYPLEKITLIYNNPNSKYSVEWNTIPNGLFYSVAMKFHYSETDITTNEVTAKSIETALGTQMASNLQAGSLFRPEKLILNFSAESFFQFLAQKIEVNPNLKRKCLYVEFIISATTPEVYTYTQVSQPSNGIIQDKPTYTNIENGVGLFSSRVTSSTRAELSPFTISSINQHPQAQMLGFE